VGRCDGGGSGAPHAASQNDGEAETKVPRVVKVFIEILRFSFQLVFLRRFWITLQLSTLIVKEFTKQA